MSTAVVPEACIGESTNLVSRCSAELDDGGRRPMRWLIKWWRNSYRAWAVMWSDTGRSYRFASI